MAKYEEHLQSAIHALCPVANKCAEELEHYQEATFADSSNFEKDSESPIFDWFLNSIGPTQMLKMINVTAAKIGVLQKIFLSATNAVWTQEGAVEDRLLYKRRSYGTEYDRKWGCLGFLWLII